MRTFSELANVASTDIRAIPVLVALAVSKAVALFDAKASPDMLIIDVSSVLQTTEDTLEPALVVALLKLIV